MNKRLLRTILSLKSNFILCSAKFNSRIDFDPGMKIIFLVKWTRAKYFLKPQTISNKLTT